VRFSSFEVDFELRELRKNGLRVPLQHKPFRILELLLKQPGSLVTRAELARVLWPHLPLSFEHSLNTAMNALRQVLEDSPRESRFIETRSGLGYRFIGEIEEADEALGPRATAYVRAESGDAHQDCLKGRYFLNKVTCESLQRAIGYFQSALEQDAACAPAWAGLADAYSRLALTGTVAAADVCHKARESAREAVQADANLAAAHVSIGFARMVFDGDWTGAETDLARAIGLDEDLADGHRVRGLLLSTSAKHEGAREEARLAQAAWSWRGFCTSRETTTGPSRNVGTCCPLSPVFGPRSVFSGWPARNWGCMRRRSPKSKMRACVPTGILRRFARWGACAHR
jgi:DNA-binding winged helix-turn-helix (wHTH) protein